MNWVLLSLLAPGTYAVNNFLDKYLLESRIPDYRSLPVFTSILAFIVGLGVSIFAGFELTSGLTLAFLLLSGVFTIFAFALYLEALITEETSLIIILLQLIPIMVLILSYIFLGETISLQQLIGFLLILGAAIASSIRKEETRIKISKALLYILLADLFWAIPFVLVKYVSPEIGFKDLLVYESWGIVLGGLVLYLFLKGIRAAFTKTIKKISKPTLLIIFINECIYLIAKLMSYLALLFGPATIVSVLGSTQIFFGLVYGTILSFYFPKIFRERLSKASLARKSIFGGVAFMGIILVS